MTIPEWVEAYWTHYRATGGVHTEAVRQLADLAVGEGAEASAAAQSLFADLVEPLSDAFGMQEAHAYVDVFAEIIDVLRNRPDTHDLACELAGPWPTENGHDLVEPHPPTRLDGVRQVVVLSRVTLGADVAMTTPIIAAVLGALPHVRVTLVGPETAHGVVAGHDRVAFRRLDYPRRGDLRTRLACSLAVRAIVADEISGLAPGTWAVIDPDSRLSQLGLVPVAPAGHTRFFPSRTLQLPGVEQLGHLASLWAQQLVPTSPLPSPQVWLTETARARAAAIRAHLTPHAGAWTVVNFGVGGNSRKSLGREFEAGLLRRLLGMGVGVLLNYGVTDSEVEETQHLVAAMAATGADVMHLPADAAPSSSGDTPGRRQIVTWQGDAGFMAALVAAADLHIGYDSAGQHVAAAVGTPGVTVFVTAAGERHFRRWSPWGSGPTHVLRVDPAAPDLAHIADQALAAAAAFLAPGRFAARTLPRLLPSSPS